MSDDKESGENHSILNSLGYSTVGTVVLAWKPVDVIFEISATRKAIY